ncbi:MAG TPA: ATP-binding cassette domain-containing protein [Solirubrobacteraceae bacterium]
MSDLLEVSGVSKRYGGVRALSDAHLNLSEGAIHGLIGPNGSGKTTLFNVITGYERIQQGAVRFRDTEITNAPPDRVFGLGIGRTFQLTRIFARMTVLENMLVATQRAQGWLRSVLRIAGSAAERRRAMELLDYVGITRLAHDPAGTLSYGQRKLLELASLLVADPDVLLLDEPAGGVNPTLIEHLADRIKELNKSGKTFLVVEHNMEFVMNLCHYVTVLSRGTPLVSGTPEEVRSNPAVLDAYLGGEDDPATQRELAEEAEHQRPAQAPRPSAAPPAERGTELAGQPRRTVMKAPVRLGGAEPLLSIRGVTAGYGGGDILKQVSFDVPQGGITCVVGPNGAGKSTLLATISGLLRASQGEIRFRGRVISRLSPRRILDLGIAHVPQAHSLFPQMTVRENVEMGAFTIGDAKLVRQRLEAVEELYPIVRERADEKAASLSGGQQRLVEFARCLMLEPAMVILDEPSMGLDPQIRRIVFEMIETMQRQGKTVLLVEQNARAGLKLSSHGVVLENGTVRLSGSGREVLEHPEIGALYLGGAVSAATASPAPAP